MFFLFLFVLRGRALFKTSLPISTVPVGRYCTVPVATARLGRICPYWIRNYSIYGHWEKRSWSWIPVRLEYGPGSGKMMRNRQIWNQNHNQFLHSTQSVTTLSPFSSKCRASWRSCLALASWAAAGSRAGRGGGASWAAASRAPSPLPWLSYCSHSLQSKEN